MDGGILRTRVERVLVGRRDCTTLVDGVLKQVEVVRDLVGDIPITGALCFVDADWPLVGGSFSTRGVHVLWPKKLTKALTETIGGGVDVLSVHASVAERFKPA